MFSLTIDVEVSQYNSRVQNLIPYFVSTNLLSGVEDTINNIKKFGNFLIPDAKTFARSAVYTLNTNYLMTTGYWSHSLLVCLFYQYILTFIHNNYKVVSRFHETYSFAKLVVEHI